MICVDASMVAGLVAEWRNATQWEATARSDERASLERILASASAPGFPGAILPWPRVGKPTIFYGTAPRPEDWRRLRPLLVAFGGPTITKFSGRTGVPNPRWGKPEAYLAEKGFAAVARLVPKDDAECKAMVLCALDRLCKLIIENPVARQRPNESTSRLLGRLDGALADGDHTSATMLYDRLRTEDRLDGLNLNYLRIQIAASFRDWRAIAEMPELLDLVASSRPAAVTAAILEALDAVYVMPAEETGNLRDALAPIVSILEDLLAPPRPRLGVGALRLAALIDASTVLHTSADAVRIRSGGTRREDTAPPAEVARLALIRAIQSESLEVLGEAISAVERLETADRERLLAPSWMREMWREAADRSGRIEVPQNWREWLSLLHKPEFTGAVDLARARVWRMECRRAIKRPHLGRRTCVAAIPYTRRACRRAACRSAPCFNKLASTG